MAGTKSGNLKKSTKSTYSTKLRDFEFRILRLLKPLELDHASVLIACSGGRDSVALLACLAELAPRLNLKLGIAYLHHGPTADKALLTYRRKAEALVKKMASEAKVPFFKAKSASELKSEESLRDFRMKALREIQEREGFSFLAYGHHADDLFETRLIRLIRGTGGQGLEAMRVSKDSILRPFLKESVSEISLYAQERGLTWYEDPSNRDSRYLRNWLRNSWLPLLEEKRPGAKRSFARSLENLLSERVEVDAGSIPHRQALAVIERAPGSDESVINRKRYMKLEIPERHKVLAAYLLGIQAREFTAKHIQELRKRIETPRKEIRFRLLKFNWEINAEQIRAFHPPK